MWRIYSNPDPHGVFKIVPCFWKVVREEQMRRMRVAIS
jgi:hypothetical protein